MVHRSEIDTQLLEFTLPVLYGSGRRFLEISACMMHLSLSASTLPMQRALEYCFFGPLLFTVPKTGRGREAKAVVNVV
jgi:hypothetical protein